MNNRFLQTLSVKPFLFLWLAEVFSQISMNLLNFTLLIVAFKLTGSNTAVSGIVLAFTLPAVLLGILAGVLVDRWNKKRVLFLTNFLRTILLLFVVFFHSELTVIYLVAFFVSVITQFFVPAETPMIPILIKKDNLMSANALFGIGIYGSVLVAYALAGPLLLLLGETLTFAVLAFLFLLATLCVSFIRVSKLEDSSKTVKQIAPSVIMGDVKSALHAISKTKEIYSSLFLLALSQFIILILAVLGPGYAKDVLHIRVDQFPLLFVTPAAIGMVIGALLIGNYFQYRSRHKVAALGMMLAGFSVMLLPFGASFSPNTHLMVIILGFSLGLTNAFIFVPSNTLIQEKTRESYRGKVYGALNSLTGVFSLIPIILVGELADFYGVALVLTWLGVLIAFIGFSYLAFLMLKKKK